MNKYCKKYPARIAIGHLTLNIFVNHLILFSAKFEICNFADDNSLYSRGMNLENNFFFKLKNANIYEWFEENSVKVNPDKFQFIILGNIGSYIFQN